MKSDNDLISASLVDWRISVLIDITIGGPTMPYCPTACGVAKELDL